MPRRVKIIDRDRGYKRLRQEFARARRSGPHVTVGIQGSQAVADHSGAGITVAQVGAYNEFGTSRIPARSFVRSTVDGNSRLYSRMLADVARSWIARRLSLAQGLGLVGAKVAGDIKLRIAAGISPPNAAATIARKGSSTPLIDTGQLRSSITSAVRGA